MTGFATYKEGVYVLAANVSSTGNYPSSGTIYWPGGRGVYVQTGTGASKLQFSPDEGTTWLDVDRAGDTYVTLSAAGAGLFELPPCLIRTVVTGSPSGLSAYAETVRG